MKRINEYAQRLLTHVSASPEPALTGEAEARNSAQRHRSGGVIDDPELRDRAADAAPSSYQLTRERVGPQKRETADVRAAARTLGMAGEKDGPIARDSADADGRPKSVAR